MFLNPFWIQSSLPFQLVHPPPPYFATPAQPPPTVPQYTGNFLPFSPPPASPSPRPVPISAALPSHRSAFPHSAHLRRFFRTVPTRSQLIIFFYFLNSSKQRLFFISSQNHRETCHSREHQTEQQRLNSPPTQVKNLPPQTRDPALHLLGSQFGKVLSVHAFISTTSNRNPSKEVFGTCTGSGWLVYGTKEEAVWAMVGLNLRGFETTLAKETVGGKLKELDDRFNTNLYLSNLPIHYNEQDLENLFHPYHVKSLRLLREEGLTEGPIGQSRGLGFARLETREAALASIKNLKNVVLPGARLPLKIRFADNPQQKEFKSKLNKTSPQKRVEQQRRRLQGQSLGILTPPPSPTPLLSPPASSYSLSSAGNRSSRNSSSNGSRPCPASPPSSHTSSKSSKDYISNTGSSKLKSSTPPVPLATPWRAPQGPSSLPPTPPHSPTTSITSSSYHDSCTQSTIDIINDFPPTPFGRFNLPMTPTVTRRSLPHIFERLPTTTFTTPTTSSSTPNTPLASPKPISRPRPTPASAGPLKTRFFVPYETLYEDVGEVEDGVSGGGGIAKGHLHRGEGGECAEERDWDELRTHKRIKEPRKSLPWTWTSPAVYR
ncbi:hypothetical protein T439DRAFT_335286 [Meredithblackwellia eburnea MCA 4105]